MPNSFIRKKDHPIPTLSFKQRHLLRELRIEFDKKARSKDSVLKHTRGPARLS